MPTPNTPPSGADPGSDVIGAPAGTEQKSPEFKAAAEQRRRFEAIITDKHNKHVTFSAMGNEVFPAVDASGKTFPLHVPEWNEFLRDRYPEKKQVQDHYVGLLRDLTSPDKEDNEEYGQKYPNGIPMKEIGRIAQLGKGNSEYQYLLKKIRRGIYRTLDFLMPFGDDDEKKKEKLEEVLRRANDMYAEYIEEVYGKESLGDFGFKNEILYEDDPAELILMAFDEKKPRQRHEAKRKLLSADEIGKASLKRRGGEHEMHRYTEMMHDAGVYYKDPENPEGLYPFYLVSRHPSKGERRCTEAYFTQTPPREVDPDMKVKRYMMRCAEIPRKNEKGQIMKDEKGKILKEKIFFHEADRRKSDSKMIQKGMIKDSKNPSQFTEDLNGKRSVFQSMGQMEAFKRHRKSCFRAQRCDIREWKMEVNTNGRGARNHERRPGQSDQLQIIKYQEEVSFPPYYDTEGDQIEPMEQFIYEHQFFDAAMFANYEYQIGVMHRQYEGNRVIDGSLAELNNPKALYGQDCVSLQFERNMMIIQEEWSREDALLWAEKYIEGMKQDICRDLSEREADAWENDFRKKHHRILTSNGSKVCMCESVCGDGI